jgi:hypothetical protein
VVESGRYPSILDIMRDIHGISGVRRTTTTLRRSAHGPREHSGHLGVDPCSFPSFRAMKSASSRSSMPLVSALGPDRPKGTKPLGAFVPVGRRTVLTQSYAPLAVKCAVDPIASIHGSERVFQDLAEVLGGISDVGRSRPFGWVPLSLLLDLDLPARISRGLELRAVAERVCAHRPYTELQSVRTTG